MPHLLLNIITRTAFIQKFDWAEWVAIIKLCNMWGMQSLLLSAKSTLLAMNDVTILGGLSADYTLFLSHVYKDLFTKEETVALFRKVITRDNTIHVRLGAALGGVVTTLIYNARETRAKVYGEDKKEKAIEAATAAYLRYLSDPKGDWWGDMK